MNAPAFQPPELHPAIRSLGTRPQWVAWRWGTRNGAQIKLPVSVRTGRGASSTRPADWTAYDQAVAFAASQGMAGVGYVTTEDDGITAVDLDKCRDPETGDVEPWAREILELAETYAEWSPSGRGIRMFWQGKIGATVKADAAHVEIYKDKRYLTVTGRHVSGTPTEIRAAPHTERLLLERVRQVRGEPAPAIDRSTLRENDDGTAVDLETGECFDSYEEAEASRLQQAPMVVGTTSAAPPAARSSATRSGNDFFATVNTRALASLPAWVPAIFPAARYQSGTGGYRVSSRDLGRQLEEDLSIVPSGIKDFGVADMGDARDGKRSAIDLVMEYGIASDAAGAALWLCDRMSIDPASLGWRSAGDGENEELGRAAAERIAANLAKGGGDSASPAPARAGLPVLIEDSDGNVHDETGALVYAAKQRDEAFQVATGGDWVHTSGLIGEIADWICDTARRPNRPLAVAAAIVTIGTMCGRHISTPTGCGTHLYIGCIGASTIGKDRPLKAIPRLLEAVGLPNLAVTGKFKSDGAIEKILIDAPCCCAIVDEMGTNLFAKMSHARASTHEQGIGGVLRELWSTSFERWQGYARAGGGAVSIASPAFSIFGASTIDEFYNSLAKDVVENGFLNRFTLIRAAPRSAPQVVDVSAVRAVPQSIVEGLADLMPTGGGNLQSGAQGYSPYTEPELRMVEFAAPEVEQAFLAFEESLLAKMDAAPEIAPYLGRTAEMTIRLATIHAVSKLGTLAAVRLEDLRWGMAVATESAQTMIDDVRDRIQEGDYQRKYRKVQSIISDAAVITKRDLTRRLNGLLMKREVDDILSGLEDAGLIAQDKTSGRGRPSCIITYTDEGGAKS